MKDVAEYDQEEMSSLWENMFVKHVRMFKYEGHGRGQACVPLVWDDMKSRVIIIRGMKPSAWKLIFMISNEFDRGV